MSRKKITLTINSKIKEIFRTNSINIHDGICYLICLHYGIDPTYIPEGLKRKVHSCNIVTKNYSTGEIIWKESIFEESETGFEWISEWMDLFKTVNPARRGTKAYVITRMKKFFVNNPEIRKQDVFVATKKYLSTVTEPTYCKKSHKFIYEQDGSSMLLDYVTNYKSLENKNVTVGRKII